jgi:hypothetical protein
MRPEGVAAKGFVMAKSAAVLEERSRQIVQRTRGWRHWPVTRLMGLSDLGEIFKSFVFLDLFDTEGGSFQVFGLRYSSHASPASPRAAERHVVETKAQLQKDGRL